MGKKRQILVIGNNTNGCTPKHEQIAYDVGVEIAKSDSVLVNGGLGGVMHAASHGAHDANGLTVGIIPQDDSSATNEFCDIVVPTGMGLTRDYLNALSADGVIIVGGGQALYLKHVHHTCTKNLWLPSEILEVLWIHT